MVAYYNEFDPKAAAWLRELIRCGHIADGIVDERSIEDVTPADLAGYAQVHFFAGIGVWSYALRAAGWSDDRPVWTGSAPCQPFSAAGKGGGFDDERHLWPAFHYLIDQCRPDVVFGEQVASKDGLGWLDLVQADLEGTGYASGAIDLCAAGVGAPHIRQRLWWFGERLADSTKPGWQPRGRLGLESNGRGSTRFEPGRLRDADGLDNDDDAGLEGQRSRHQAESGRVAAAGPVTEAGEPGGVGNAGGQSGERDARGLPGAEGEGSSARRADGYDDHRHSDAGATGGLADRDGHEPRTGRDGGSTQGEGLRSEPSGRGDAGGLANPTEFRRLRGRSGGESDEPGAIERSARLRPASAGPSTTGPTNGLWADADWLFCRDGRWRPVESGTFPLVDGASERVGRLRGYGNAIVAPAAQAFIEAYLEAAKDGGFRMTSLSDLSHGVFD